MTPFNSDVAPLDAETVATYVGQNLDINSIILGNEYFYQSLTLCVIDAVYSIGVKYQGVEKVVERYCKHYGLVKIRTPRENIPPKGPQESIADLCNKFKKNGHEYMATDVFNNRKKTSTRVDNMSKSEAVSEFASALQNHGVASFEDVPKAIKNKALEDEIKGIPGQGSGISLKYFFMLAGKDDQIKPDRMILRFVDAALKRKPGTTATDEAETLLRDAHEILRKEHSSLTLRELDYVIWDHQRSQDKRRKS